MHCQHDICQEKSFMEKKKKHKQKKHKAENTSRHLKDIKTKCKKKQKDQEVSACFECADETDVLEGYCSETSEIHVKGKHRKKHKRNLNEDINENLGITKVKHKKKHKECREECESVSPHYKKEHKHEIIVNTNSNERLDKVNVKHKKKHKKHSKECETALEPMEDCREHFEESREVNGVFVGSKKKKKHKYHKSEHKEKNENWTDIKNKENIQEIGEITGTTLNPKKKHKKKDKHNLCEYEENVQENTNLKHKKKHKQRLGEVSVELQEVECEGFENTKHKKKHKMKDHCVVEVFENKKIKRKYKHINDNVKHKKHRQDTEMLEEENTKHKKKHKQLAEVLEEEHMDNKKKHKLNMELDENQSKKHKKKRKQNVELDESGTEKQSQDLEEFADIKGTKEHRQYVEDLCMEHKNCVSDKVKCKNKQDLDRSGKVKDKKKQRQEHEGDKMFEVMSTSHKGSKESIEKGAVKVKRKRQRELNKDKIDQCSFSFTKHHHRNETNMTETTDGDETTEPQNAKKRRKHRHCEEGKVNVDRDGGSLNLIEMCDNAEDGQQEIRQKVDHQEEQDVIIIESESDEGNCNPSEVLLSTHTLATDNSSATLDQNEMLQQPADTQGSMCQDEFVDIEGDNDSGNPLMASACGPDKWQHFVYIIQNPDDDETPKTGHLEEVTQSGLEQNGLIEVTPMDDSPDYDNHFSWSLSEEERLQNNWNTYFQNHPSDEPGMLLEIPEDASLEEKRRIRKIRTETKFLECLADGISKPLPVIRDKALSMFVKNVSTSRKGSTLSGWSDTEIKQLENNWKQFFKDYPMDKPYELLSPVHLLSRERHSFLMKFKKQTSFMERLRQGINRSAMSVYHKAKRHFYPYTEVTGKFSDEEMLELKKLITVHGKKLLLISTLMGRNPTYIEFQFKQLEREERKCVTGRWSPEEEKRLFEAVSEQVGFDVTDNKHCFDKRRFSNLSWREIAEKVQTRDFFQCFQKWMYTNCITKHSKRSDVTLERQLLKLIDEQDVEEYRDIDWLAIYEQIKIVPSPNSLKRLFRNMCNKVPNREKKSHKELLATLMRVHNLFCENPSVVSYK